MAHFAVLGATSWGTTLAWLLSANGHHVSLVVRDTEEERDVAARRGVARLPEVVLPDTVRPCLPGEFPAGVEGVIVAVPAQSLRGAVPASIGRETPVLSAAKGLEHGSGARMSEVLVACGWRQSRVAALSGPNLAHEVARGLPAAAVVACPDEVLARLWQEALSGSRFRVYRSADVAGVEIAGALKNVIAIAAGAAAGLGFGTNTVATILTRGLAEMTRLGVALGADPVTFQGLAGVGDLAATCFSPLSRNRRLGDLVARGLTPAEAQAEIGEVVEGVATAPVALALGRRHGVELPIAEQVVEALAGRVTVPGALAQLLGRSLKPEASGPERMLD